MYFKVTTEADFLLTYHKLPNVNSNLVSDQFHIPMLSSLQVPSSNAGQGSQCRPVGLGCHVGPSAIPKRKNAICSIQWPIPNNPPIDTKISQISFTRTKL